MTSPGACAALYQTIWQDCHLVRGNGFAHLSFWITKEFCIQLELSTIEMLIFHKNFKFPNTVFMKCLRLIHLNDHCSITL